MMFIVRSILAQDLNCSCPDPKSASKTRYTCPSCELNAWAKPGVRLMCGECDEPMAAAEEAE